MRSRRFDREFYTLVFTVAGPVLVQNVITNFVNLLDNIMVGQIGTESMSGVAIVNQLLFVFNLCIFGGMAGPGIFAAQYAGKGDTAGLRSAARAKLYIAAGAVALFAAALWAGGSGLISLFLHEGQDDLDLAATLRYGRDYLNVMVWQMIPFAFSQVYSSTLRETGESMLPMKAGIAAVGVNLGLNYVLIFGKLGAPALGVTGAAIATLIARCVECAIVVVWSHRHAQRAPFARGLYRTLRVPRALVKQIAVMGTPLLLNEVLWSAGMATLNQCYSVRGLEVVSSTNIVSTVSNLFFCAFLAMGVTTSIILGQLLGSGQPERAVTAQRKLTVFTVVMNAAVGALMALLAPLVPDIYNTTDTVKALAAQMLLVNAAMMPFNAYVNVAYFTLRAGGKTVITFLFDSGFIWCICVPLAFVLSRFTAMPILPLYICVQAVELVKCLVGAALVRRRSWVNNLVRDI
ncbi:MAG: MATE family efflux transporter [Ruminococcaceae bacterium]|nr:MATE family efflux transporter [Oscillospiraceae bacterium]